MERVSAGLHKTVSDVLRRMPARQAPLLAWPLACGSAVAERTRALECSQGVLRVEVPDAGWRQELKALTPAYLAAINRYVDQSVKGIEFVISGATRH